ncbi:type IV pilus modification PilV family protein [Caulobacter endophyticus]|uniref:Uncharacterized protein n=1 Tax=Caulobacter endophyticus TaxID=2172652 RepID=A0A2T9JYW9_9CAUL|nr:hypothetical protein [Caulobacter endophyticus]PVM88823.1 hypothetical protein DDF67_12650 [Caulobacter endophyticus]
MNDKGYLAADAIVALLLVAIGLAAVLKVQAQALEMSRRAKHLRAGVPAAALAWARLGEVKPGLTSAYVANVVDEVEIDGRVYSVCRVQILAPLTAEQPQRRVTGRRFCGEADAAK